MNTNRIVTDRFSNPESEKLYREHWPDEPQTYTDLYEEGQQCGGCSFFAKFNSDWGLCCHPESRHHLETVFEHFTCPRYVHEGWGSHSFVDFAKYPDLQWVFTHYELPEHLYHKVKQRAVATNPDESEYEMYRLIIATLEREFGGSS
jgi:hypothetical protein